MKVPLLIIKSWLLYLFSFTLIVTEAADILQNLSLDSETNAVAGHEYANKVFFDSYMLTLLFEQ